MNNYRCLQITSVFMRLYEHLMSPFLSLSSLLKPDQFGFRANRNTYDCLFQISENAKNWVARGYQIPVCFLDIKKAFDRVWHNGLLAKLYMKGIRGFRLKWLQSYLSNRKYKLQHNGYESVWVPVVAGVPQGGVLSPDLFNIYIDDMPVLPSILSCKFADDVALTPKVAGRAGNISLRTNLDKISVWLYHWKLEVSAGPSGKSGIVIFKNNLGRPAADFVTYVGRDDIPASEKFVSGDFFISGVLIAVVSSYKYVGVIFNCNFNWTEQFQYILAKATKTSLSIARLINRNGPPGIKSIIQLVHSLLLPQITYGIAFWNPSQEMFAALERKIVLPLRRALGLSKVTSNAKILAECRIPSLKLLRQYFIISYGNRAVRGLPTDDLKLIHDYYYAMHSRIITTKKKLDSCLSLITEHRALYAAWSFSFSISKDDLKAKVAALSQWTNSPMPGLFECPSNLPTYMLYDPTPAIRLRSRLRFDMACLNVSLKKRRVTISDECSSCAKSGIHVPESLEHVLLKCPAYDRARFKLANAMLLLDVKDLSVLIILGQCDSIAKKSRVARYLQLSLEFIMSVDTIRKSSMAFGL